jgi:hypothetical protein
VDYLQTVAILLNASIFCLVVELIRRNRLKERYSLIWLGASLCMIVFSIRSVLHTAAHWVGIDYPPSFLYLAAILFITILLLHFSVVISRLTEQNKHLAQEIGILKNSLAGMEPASRSQQVENDVF